MRKWIIFLGICLATLPLLRAQEGVLDFSTVTLTDKDSVAMTNLDSLFQQRATAFIFMNAECPICNRYGNTFQQLPAEFPDITFVGVFTHWESPAIARQFAEEYQLTGMRLVWDGENELKHLTGATTTPEVFLVSPQGELLYRGAIDNWFFGLGKYRPVVTETFLKDAINAFLTGQPIRVKATKPVGCVFE